MPPVSPPRGLSHSPWQYLLQALGVFSILGFHIGLPGSKAGWIAVELFFVTAGLRMAGSIHRDEPLGAYLARRTKRLAPEVLAVWLVVLALTLAGMGTPGMRWFLVSAPFCLQNLSLPFFEYRMPMDAVFGPLWFTAALIQLQVTAFLLKGLLRRTGTAMLVTITLALGVGSRAAFGLATDGSLAHLGGRAAEMLYCMPFCHMEAVLFGFIIGRGSAPNLARKLPLILGTILLGAFINMALSGTDFTRASLGYGFPLRDNFSHLWGYPLLSLGAAALLSLEPMVDAILTDHPDAAFVTKVLGLLAPFAYGVYSFHGMVIFLLSFVPPLAGNEPGVRILAFLATFGLSLAIAVLLRKLGGCIQAAFSKT